jgi:hypothetical protein
VNELTLVKQLRDEVPVRDAAARAAASRVLADRMRGRGGGRRRWAMSGLAVACAATALAIALVTGIGVGREPSAAAAQVLRTAATALRASGEAPVLHAGEYWYVESRGQTLATTAPNQDASATFSALMTTVHREWVGRDGSGRIVRTDEDPRFPTLRDRERWQAAGSPDLGSPRIDGAQPAGSMLFPFGSRTLSYSELRALPSDPDALAALIDQAAVRNSWSLSWQKLDLIGELMRNAPLSPAQGAALYEIAARLPDVELVGPTTDPSGRPGMGVAVSSNGLREELVIDTRTGELLGDRTVDVRTGQVQEAMSYVSTGVVSSTTATP